MPVHVLRFGPFELDTQTNELRRAGRVVHLPLQPARVLCLLAEHPGRLVTREETCRHIWGADTFVDTALGLNYCLRSIRSALHDTPRAPRYVETLRGQGYRFVAAVDATGTQETAAPREIPSMRAAKVRRPHRVSHDARERFMKAERLFEEKAFLAERVLPQAECLYEEAARLDPEFAEAWAALAGILVFQAFFGVRPYDDVLPRAREAARRALALSTRAGRAWAALGLISLYFDWDFAAAKDFLDQAVRLAPNNHTVLHAYSDYLLVTGHPQESLEYVRLARERNPHCESARVYFPGHAVAAGRYEEAIVEAHDMLAVFPDVRNARHFLAKALWLVGRQREALAEYSTLWGPSSARSRVFQAAFERDGAPAAMRALADYLARESGPSAASPFEIASYYAVSASSDEAFFWLERAFTSRTAALLHVPADPFFDSIRPDPRIDGLCRRVGLPITAWRAHSIELPPPVVPG
jgi:DNA-binding winged helix-turn-helix (wHTH) protein